MTLPILKQSFQGKKGEGFIFQVPSSIEGFFFQLPSSVDPGLLVAIPGFYMYGHQVGPLDLTSPQQKKSPIQKMAGKDVWHGTCGEALHQLSIALEQTTLNLMS